MKRFASLFLAVVFVFSLAVCGSASAEGKYTAGTYTATAAGHNGSISVTVTVDENAITDLALDLSVETESVGQAAEDTIIAQVMEAQSAEIDGVSGATDTVSAVQVALRSCLAEAEGTETKATMAAGTYEASAYGFYPGMPINVEVTVNEDSIENIEIVGENMETQLMLRSVEDKLIPRILESQSIGVDSICGATMTSSALKTAVRSCLTDALTAAGSDEAALAQFQQAVTYETEAPIELDTDVLVVGMGASGITAALSAAENGAKVLAIDKAGRYGGTLTVTGEAMAVNPEKFEAEFNNGEDYTDPEALKEDWVGRTHGDAKEEIIDEFIDESGETLDWLYYDHDWQFATAGGGHASYATFNVCFEYLPAFTYGDKDEIAGYIDRLIADYTEAGGEYMLETEASELIYDAETNTVTGVKAIGYDGQEYIIHADAVVLATGGFGSNEELMDEFMIDDYYPLSGTWYTYGMKTNDGKMIASALEIGAGTCNPSVPPISHLAGFPVTLSGFGTHTKDGQVSFFTGKTPIWSEGDIPTTLDVAADALAIKRDGTRFMNEEGFATHETIKAGPNYYTIWSQTQFDKYEAEGFDYEDLGPSLGYLGCQSTIPAGEPLPNFDAVIQAGIDSGYIFKADTIEELAEMIDVDPAVLRNTVDTYNAACAAGEDTEFGKDPQYLDAVDGGPYYAVFGVSFIYTTGGGLDVDSNFQVLQADGETLINGLYAIGTDSVGVVLSNQEQYIDYGGLAAGYSFTSGRLVGEYIAKTLAE